MRENGKAIRAGRFTFAAVSLLASLAGCSETVYIKTYPPGASVFVDGNEAGVSPVEYAVPKSEVASKHSFVIEKKGFEPITGTLPTRLARGRVVAAIFTVGTIYLLRSPWYFPEREAYQLTQSVENDPDAEHDRAVGKRLRELQDSDPNAVILLPPARNIAPMPAK